MGTLTQEDDSDVEGEVDLKVELISSLEELRKSRMKNNSLKRQLSKYQEEAESLKQEVVKFKRKVERLKYQQYVNEKVKEKIQDSERLGRSHPT